MSSIYNAICLSHDPGLVLGPDFTYEETNSLNSRDQLTGHETCDIVIGRYSYPLIEAACLGRQLPGPTGCKGHHRNVKWIDRDWLRLLATAGPDAHPEAMRALSAHGCWPLDRLHRLRDELGLPEPPAATPDPAAEARAVVQAVTREQLHDAIRTLARLDRTWWDDELRRHVRINHSGRFPR